MLLGSDSHMSRGICKSALFNKQMSVLFRSGFSLSKLQSLYHVNSLIVLKTALKADDSIKRFNFNNTLFSSLTIHLSVYTAFFGAVNGINARVYLNNGKLGT